MCRLFLSFGSLPCRIQPVNWCTENAENPQKATEENLFKKKNTLEPPNTPKTPKKLLSDNRFHSSYL
jgi:hypothetical protein